MHHDIVDVLRTLVEIRNGRGGEEIGVIGLEIVRPRDLLQQLCSAGAVARNGPQRMPEPAQAEEFYRTLGIGAADPDGSDVFMIRKGGDLLLKGVTLKGEKLLTQLSLLTAASADEEKYFEDYIIRGRDFKTRFTFLADKSIAKKLEDIFHDSDFWMKVSGACLSCGVCTFVCPNCYCFDICDETLFSQGIRRRVWDACMFTDFTLEASGHNPRTQVFQKLRQKIKHKYSYHVRKYGVISCVGCGRCTKHCPVNIDIFSIVEEAMKA